MRLLFTDITTLNENGDAHKHRYVLVEDNRIAGIFDARPAGIFDREICGKNKTDKIIRRQVIPQIIKEVAITTELKSFYLDEYIVLFRATNAYDPSYRSNKHHLL